MIGDRFKISALDTLDLSPIIHFRYFRPVPKYSLLRCYERDGEMSIIIMGRMPYV